MEKLSREAENLIIESVSSVNDLVNQGTDPTEAAIKVAEERQLQPGYIQLVAQAYNIGATNEHRSHEKTVLGKAASFALIDPKEVIRARYPVNIKSAAAELQESAVAADYDGPPSWIRRREQLKVATVAHKWALTEKKAEAYPRDPQIEFSKKLAQQDKTQKTAEAARTEVSRCYNKVLETTNSIRLYFKQAAPHVPFKNVQASCEMKYGDKVKPLFTRLVESNPEFAKRAAANSVLGPMRGQPYNLIQTWVAQVDEFHKARETHKKASQEARTALAVDPRVTRPVRPLHVLDGVVSLSKHSSGKEAASHPSVGGNVLRPTPAKKGPNRPTKAANTKKLLQKKADDRPTLHRFNQMMYGDGMGTRGLQSFFSSQMDPISGGTQADILSARRLAFDPRHTHAMDSLRTQAMLHDMMLNDEVISGYDPSEVASVYGDLRNLAPELARHPASARAFVRKHLAQGQVDPYDLDLAATLENRLRKRDEQHINVNTARVAPTAMSANFLRGTTED